MALFGLFSKEKKEKLNSGLEKTKESLFSKLAKTVVGKSKVDDEVLDDLEEVLITSDVGVDTTLKIIERIEARVSKERPLCSQSIFPNIFTSFRFALCYFAHSHFSTIECVDCAK